MNTMPEGDSGESIKTTRVKSFFIQAAKGIIISEGYEKATVRNIARKAGYAVSTLYQYFGDLDCLLHEVKRSLIFDLMTKVQEHVVNENYTVEDIKTQNHAFINFFVEQPNIYPFLNADSSAPGEDKVDNLVFTEDYYKIYESFSRRGIIRKEDIPNIAKIIVYSMNGMLRIYFSNQGLTKESIYADLDSIIGFLFEKKK